VSRIGYLANEPAQGRLRALDRASAEEFLRAFVGIAASYDGRLVIGTLIEELGLESPSFAADTHLTAFREGKRAVAAYLKQLMIDNCPEHAESMLVETHKRKAQKTINDKPSKAVTEEPNA
jgi:hypothetical protein